MWQEEQIKSFHPLPQEEQILTVTLMVVLHHNHKDLKVRVRFFFFFFNKFIYLFILNKLIDSVI